MSTLPATLRRRRSEIVALDPLTADPKEFSTGNWMSHFSGDHDVEDLCETFDGLLRRADLVELAAAIWSNPSDLIARRRLVIGTFMWGYGKLGGRSYRNAKSTLSDLRLDTATRKGIEALGEHDIQAAYSAFSRPTLTGYGEGFFTKFLYFAGTATYPQNPNPEDPHPLIYDSVIRSKLAFYERVLGVRWREGWPTQNAMRYLWYCRTLNLWANDLGCRRPDQVEAFIFQDETFNVTAALLPVAATALQGLTDEKAEEQLISWLAALPLPLLDALADQDVVGRG